MHTPPLASHIGKSSEEIRTKMLSSKAKSRRGQPFTNFLKGTERIFRHGTKPTLAVFASPSGGEIRPTPEIPQRKGSTGSEVKGVDDPVVPHLRSRMPVATVDVWITIQTEVDIAIIRGVQEVNIVDGESAITKDARDSTLAGSEDDNIVSSDSIRTIERYKKAIERIKNTLELRRDS